MTDPVEDEVEASRAPLIDHLIELRTRLINALIAFVVMFIACFAGAKYIYNILVQPYVWAVGDPSKAHMVYTHALEFFFTQLQVAMFGAGFLAFPVIANQIYKFVAPDAPAAEPAASAAAAPLPGEPAFDLALPAPPPALSGPLPEPVDATAAAGPVPAESPKA